MAKKSFSSRSRRRSSMSPAGTINVQDWDDWSQRFETIDYKKRQLVPRL
jgi:hypothetical protein